MTTREKLDLMDASGKRNEALEMHFKMDNDRRVLEAMREARDKAASIHRTIELYADALLESLDILAAFHGEKRGELLELLVCTAWALEQTRSQEG